MLTKETFCASSCVRCNVLSRCLTAICTHSHHVSIFLTEVRPRWKPVGLRQSQQVALWLSSSSPAWRNHSRKKKHPKLGFVNVLIVSQLPEGFWTAETFSHFVHTVILALESRKLWAEISVRICCCHLPHVCKVEPLKALPIVFVSVRQRAKLQRFKLKHVTLLLLLELSKSETGQQEKSQMNICVYNKGHRGAMCREPTWLT